MRKCNWPFYSVYVNGELVGEFQLDEWDEYLFFVHRQRVIFGALNVSVKSK